MYQPKPFKPKKLQVKKARHKNRKKKKKKFKTRVKKRQLNFERNGHFLKIRHAQKKLLTGILFCCYQLPLAVANSRAN